MKLKNSYPIHCPCGHEGRIELSESSVTESNYFWRSYSPVDLNGNFFMTTNASWDRVLQHLKPSCPSCHTHLSMTHMTVCPQMEEVAA